MKRVSIILITLAIINLPMSCGDDCGDFTMYKSSIASLSASVMSYTSESSTETMYSDSISTDFHEAAIKVEVDEAVHTEISEANDKSFSFISSAHACSPPLPEPTQSIESIVVTSGSSIFAGGMEYAAGESLNDLFLVRAGFNNIGTTYTIDNYIQAQNENILLFGETWGGFAVFQLIDKPDQALNQTLTFAFRFTDGTEVETTSSAFEVMN